MFTLGKSITQLLVSMCQSIPFSSVQSVYEICQCIHSSFDMQHVASASRAKALKPKFILSYTRKAALT